MIDSRADREPNTSESGKGVFNSFKSGYCAHNVFSKIF